MWDKVGRWRAGRFGGGRPFGWLPGGGFGSPVVVRGGSPRQIVSRRRSGRGSCVGLVGGHSPLQVSLNGKPDDPIGPRAATDDSATPVQAATIENARPFDRARDPAAIRVPVWIGERHVERSVRRRSSERSSHEVDRVSGLVGVEHDEQVDIAVAGVIAAGDGAIEPDCGWFELGHEVGDDEVGPFVESSAVPNGFAVFDCPRARHAVKSSSVRRVEGSRRAAEAVRFPVQGNLQRCMPSHCQRARPADADLGRHTIWRGGPPRTTRRRAHQARQRPR